MLRPGFRLGIYVFKDAEVVDFAAPYGVFSVARRYDPELDAFLIADAMRPVQAQAGFTVLPNYCFDDTPAMDAFLIPGGFGTRQEMYNRRLHEFVRSLPEECLMTSVCTALGYTDAWDSSTACRPPIARSPTSCESGPSGKVPIDRLAEIAPACRISRARFGGRRTHRDRRRNHLPGLDMGFHLLRRAGYDEHFVTEVARVMEYSDAYELYRKEWETAGQAPPT